MKKCLIVFGQLFIPTWKYFVLHSSLVCMQRNKCSEVVDWYSYLWIRKPRFLVKNAKLVTLDKKNRLIILQPHIVQTKYLIELLNNNSHGLSPPGGLVSPSGGFLSLLCDQGLHFVSIKLCLALSHQGAIIKISVVRCYYLWCLGAQCLIIFEW